MQPLREIRDEFLSNLNKKNNFNTLTEIEEKFDEKVSRLIFVIKRMESKRAKLIKKLKGLEENIEKTKYYTANSMRIIGKEEIKNMAKVKIIDGKLNLNINKEIK